LDVLLKPHRLVLWSLGCAALVELARRRRDPAVRRFLWTWAALGAFEVAGCVAGYLKAMGFDNNLYVADVWLVLPALVVASGEPRARPLWIVWISAAMLALFPFQALDPTARLRFARDAGLRQPAIRDSHYRYAEAFERSVREDLEQGRRVLVAHGTMVLLRSGSGEVPRDRANSVLELAYGGRAELARTRERLESRYYDRIYMPGGLMFNSSWYGGEVVEALRTHYRPTGRIPDAQSFEGPASPTIGFDLMEDIEILSPRGAPPDAARPPAGRRPRARPRAGR
jgi:hypothetical protein